jgi:hypothetical protein
MLERGRCQCRDGHCIFQVLLSVIYVETFEFLFDGSDCTDINVYHKTGNFMFCFNYAICCLFKLYFIFCLLIYTIFNDAVCNSDCRG